MPHPLHPFAFFGAPTFEDGIGPCTCASCAPPVPFSLVSRGYTQLARAGQSPGARQVTDKVNPTQILARAGAVPPSFARAVAQPSGELPCHPDDLHASSAAIMAQRTPHQFGAAEQLEAVQESSENELQQRLLKYSQLFTPDSEMTKQAREKFKQLPKAALANAETQQYMQLKAYTLYEDLLTFFADVGGMKLVPSIKALREGREPTARDTPLVLEYLPASHTYRISFAIHFPSGQLPDADDHWISTFIKNHENTKIVRLKDHPCTYQVLCHTSPLAPESRQDSKGQTLNVTEPVSAFDILRKRKPHLLPESMRHGGKGDIANHFLSTAPAASTSTSTTPATAKPAKKTTTAEKATAKTKTKVKAKPKGQTKETVAAKSTTTQTTAKRKRPSGNTPSDSGAPPKAKRARAISSKKTGPAPQTSATATPPDDPPAASREANIVYSAPKEHFALERPVFTAELNLLVRKLTLLGSSGNEKAALGVSRFIRMQLVRLMATGTWIRIYDLVDMYLRYTTYRIMTDNKIKSRFAALLYHFFANGNYVTMEESLAMLKTGAVCACTGRKLSRVTSAVGITIAPPPANADESSVSTVYQYYIHRKKLEQVKRTHMMMQAGKLVDAMRDTIRSACEPSADEMRDLRETQAENFVQVMTSYNRLFRMLYTTYTFDDISVMTSS